MYSFSLWKIKYYRCRDLSLRISCLCRWTAYVVLTRRWCIKKWSCQVKIWEKLNRRPPRISTLGSNSLMASACYVFKFFLAWTPYGALHHISDSLNNNNRNNTRNVDRIETLKVIFEATRLESVECLQCQISAIYACVFVDCIRDGEEKVRKRFGKFCWVKDYFAVIPRPLSY